MKPIASVGSLVPTSSPRMGTVVKLRFVEAQTGQPVPLTTKPTSKDPVDRHGEFSRSVLGAFQRVLHNHTKRPGVSMPIGVPNGVRDQLIGIFADAQRQIRLWQEAHEPVREAILKALPDLKPRNEGGPLMHDLPAGFPAKGSPEALLLTGKDFVRISWTEESKKAQEYARLMADPATKTATVKVRHTTEPNPMIVGFQLDA